MNKQIIILAIFTALINFTTHTMERYINSKKSYAGIINQRCPRKKPTREESITNIINDKSHQTDLVRIAIISSIIHQLELRNFIAG